MSIGDNVWIDLSVLTVSEREEFRRLSDPTIVLGHAEFASGKLDDRWIELYLKAARARLSRPNSKKQATS